MDDVQLYLPTQVDRLFGYPLGRTARLARQGRIRFVRLPDGEIRIPQSVIDQILEPVTARPALRLAGGDNAR